MLMGRFVPLEQSNSPLAIKTGIDLVHMPRFEKHVTDQRFLHRILTDREMELFEALTTTRRRLEFLCGRYACKEAYSKAVGTGIGVTDFHDFEVLKNDLGAPVSDKGAVSISHDGAYAIGMVIIYG